MAPDSSSAAQAAEWATRGLVGPLGRGMVTAAVSAVTADPDSRVRIAALGALVRRAGARPTRIAWTRAAADPDGRVRRRAAELAPLLATPPVRRLARLLDDDDPLVAETAAWALGECGDRARFCVRRLGRLATTHDDPLVREAAVAALGAIGDRRGVGAILAATTDKPAVRRRAVLALAPFEGEEVDTALIRASTDRDWQVRDAARALGVSGPGACP